ncbi:Short-chain dehydrogenase reductase 5-like protein [Drosera capensis]
MSQQRSKVCPITGAASGIGEEALRLFIEHGAFVVAADVQDELGEKVVTSIGSVRVAYHHCDVRDETVNFTLEKFGNLHVLCSNARIMESYSSIVDFDLEVFDKVMAINVRGVAATIKYAARAMIAKGTRVSRAKIWNEAQSKSP